MMLLAMAVAPAVFEELAFRGYIQSTFRGLPLWITAAANGLLFSIMHQSPQQAGYTFVMGIFFVLIVHHSRSIMAGIISHFIINATQVTLMFSAGRAAEIMADVPTVEATSDMQLVVVAAMTFVAVFTTILTVVLYKRFVKENTPPIDEKNDTNDTNKGKERE
jgi:membrane protease YdiL (CAAX protease family)